eukprot:1729077-Prymnesium_polylepis.1
MMLAAIIFVTTAILLDPTGQGSMVRSAWPPPLASSPYWPPLLPSSPEEEGEQEEPEPSPSLGMSVGSKSATIFTDIVTKEIDLTSNVPEEFRDVLPEEVQEFQKWKKVADWCTENTTRCKEKVDEGIDVTRSWLMTLLDWVHDNPFALALLVVLPFAGRAKEAIGAFIDDLRKKVDAWVEVLLPEMDEKWRSSWVKSAVSLVFAVAAYIVAEFAEPPV